MIHLLELRRYGTSVALSSSEVSDFAMGGCLRIAQVAPLYESVPPKQYGGTERVVSYLTEELVDMGHEVTLFASGDSETRAKLVPCAPTSLRLNEECVDQLALHILMLEKVFSQSSRFDCLHFHIDYLHYPISRRLQIPHITTLHGRLNIPELVPLYKEFRDMPVVSISIAQKKPLPDANWMGTVYHGLPVDLYKPSFKEGRHLTFLGRISREKRLDRAIRIAVELDIPIKIGAKISKEDQEYFKQEIKPLFDNPLVHFIGEVNETKKAELLRDSIALLFPIDWEEPFGLVMIEAMATGTPVVAWNHGSVPEVIENGVTGYIVNNLPEAIQAVKKLSSFDRAQCFQVFQERFLARRMAEDYLEIYERCLQNRMPLRKIS